MNWMVVQGLREQGETDAANELQARTLDLIDHTAFYEYFSPLTGRGFGADEFSWTAALVLDLLFSADLPTTDPDSTGDC
jgi:glycogen debranching enzyme